MARHGGDDGDFYRFGTRPFKWRIRRKDDQRGAPAMDSKTLVQKLLSTLEGDDGKTVAEIADGCKLALRRVQRLMARHGGDDGVFLGFGTRGKRQWRNRPNSDQGAASATNPKTLVRNSDQGAASAKDKKRDRSEDVRDDDGNAALAKRKKS